ncbi:hypothetical protein MVEN_01073200 [Mycena venus]|uniref:Uncharacterized protein n=1 Tax=Mycena venus TaxID=2733690 RepID=A0A8H6Y5Y2_9AGAR|nr:hypothetical protein MVEN_01073200 [Mycena venus]
MRIPFLIHVTLALSLLASAAPVLDPHVGRTAVRRAKSTLKTTAKVATTKAPTTKAITTQPKPTTSTNAPTTTSTRTTAKTSSTAKPVTTFKASSVTAPSTAKSSTASKQSSVTSPAKSSSSVHPALLCFQAYVCRFEFKQNGNEHQALIAQRHKLDYQGWRFIVRNTGIEVTKRLNGHLLRFDSCQVDCLVLNESIRIRARGLVFDGFTILRAFQWTQRIRKIGFFHKIWQHTVHFGWFEVLQHIRGVIHLKLGFIDEVGLLDFRLAVGIKQRGIAQQRFLCFGWRD